jgi:uncharacterized membrane protein YbhN (UPF0104 family)
VSAALVWWAFSKIDFGPTWSTLRGIAPAALGLVFVLLGVQLWVAALRLRAILNTIGVAYPIGAAFDVILIGAFFSQTLISFVGGDAMRVWRIVRSGAPFGEAAKAVLLDRVAGFGGLFILLLAATPFLARIISSPQMWAGQVIIVLLALGGVAGVLVLRRFTDHFPEWRSVAAAREIVDTGLQIWRSKEGVIVVVGLSLTIQLMNVLVLYIISRGLGVELRFVDGVLLFPTVLFLSMLPVSVSGWGVREGAMVAGLALVGVPAHQSLALSVCFGLCLAAVSVPGGVVWLLSRHKPVRA